MKISIGKLIFALFFLCMILPSFFSSAAIDLLENILFLAAFMWLFQKKYRPSKLVVLVCAYICYLLLISYVNKTPIMNIHILVNYSKWLVLFAYIDFMCKRKQDLFQIIWIVVFVLAVINTISIIVFPDGFRNVIYVWNEYGASDEIKQWVFGNKNDQALWYILLLLATYLRWHPSKRKFAAKAMNVFAISLSVLTVALVKSSTGLVAVIVVAVAIIISFNKHENRIIMPDAKAILIGYAILTFLILVGATGFLQPIVGKLFGKDLTFSSRTIVWGRTLLQILEKPVFGWGIIGDESTRSLLGSIAFTNAHNQVLNTIFQGGIILFGLLVFIFVELCNGINSSKQKAVSIVAMGVMCAVLIEMLFEVILGSVVSWIVIVLCYVVTRYYSSIGDSIRQP